VCVCVWGGGLLLWEQPAPARKRAAVLHPLRCPTYPKTLTPKPSLKPSKPLQTLQPQELEKLRLQLAVAFKSVDAERERLVRDYDGRIADLQRLIDARPHAWPASAPPPPGYVTLPPIAPPGPAHESVVARAALEALAGVSTKGLADDLSALRRILSRDISSSEGPAKPPPPGGAASPKAASAGGGRPAAKGGSYAAGRAAPAKGKPAPVRAK